MSAPRLPLLVLASTVFLTACAPTERPATARPPEERAVSAGSASEGSAAGNAGAASPSRTPVRAVSAGAVRPAMDPVPGQRESVQNALSRTPERAGALTVALPLRANLERRPVRAEVGAASAVAPRGRAGVSPAGATPLPPNAAVKAVGTSGAGSAEPVAELPLAVVAIAQAEGFTPEQMRVLIQMGESFLADTAAGSPLISLTPNGGGAPLTAAEIWEASTRASDERFRAMFGYQAFNAMQLQRARDAYAEAKAQQAISTP